MTLIGLIDDRERASRRFDASLHGMRLTDDETIAAGFAHNRSHAALERMKQRRSARGH